jgi:hypothetical protein
MFLNCFDVLILKINLKNKKNYFDIFLSKNTLKNNYYHNAKHCLNFSRINNFQCFFFLSFVFLFLNKLSYKEMQNSIPFKIIFEQI